MWCGCVVLSRSQGVSAMTVWRVVESRSRCEGVLANIV